MILNSMNLTFKQKIKNVYIPPIDDKYLWDFLHEYKFSKPLYIPITPKPLYKINNCHNNVIDYINKYGGDRVIGFYMLKEKNSNNFIGITHSVVYKNGVYLDITPVNHTYNYNIFIPTDKKELDVSRFEYFDNQISYEFYQKQSNP